MVLRIALWSAPRTVSTALLRSFVERPDTSGVDEPLYAWYLSHTGREHPMRAEVLASQSHDWREVRDRVLLGPCETEVQFVKHMAHHLVGDLDLSFADAMANVLLIRDPREMLPSLIRDLGRIEQEETGYGQQSRLLRRFRERSARDPIVVDARDLLDHPEGILRALCAGLGLQFEPCMLRWEPGRHACYGAWAPYWYGNVEKSTRFLPYRPKTEPFPEEHRDLLEWARPLYQELRAARLRA